MWEGSWVRSVNKSTINGVKPTLLVTTEDKHLFDSAAQVKSLEDGHSLFRAVYNPYDVIQGTGSVHEVRDLFSLDKVMISALSSLKLQLLPRFTLANCCSNFHALLRDLLTEGCGGFHSNVFQCIQDHPNKNYRLCCAWDRSVGCKAKKSEK